MLRLRGQSCWWAQGGLGEPQHQLPHSARAALLAWFTAGATFPKIQFFPLPLEHCILFNPSPVTQAPALFQLDSKNNLFIHTAHAIIS